MTNVQALLLDLLSSVRIVLPVRFTELSEDEWFELADLAKDHRLEPSLYHCHEIRGKDWDVPEQILSEWKRSYRESAIQSLRIRKAIFDVYDTLSKHDIDHVVLKGGWLSCSIYKIPALRPMRDVDILVSPDKIEKSYEALLGSGFSRFENDHLSVGHALKHHKHMPAIVHEKTGVMIELHFRVLGHSGDERLPRCFDPEYIFEQRARLDHKGNPQIPSLSLEENLAHIIAHAFDEHLLDNGPVILADIKEMLSTRQINWPVFWRITAEGGWTNASCTIFDLVESFHGPQPITWFSDNRVRTPDDVLRATAQLCVQPYSRRAENALKAELARSESRIDAWTLMSRRLLPARHILISEGNFRPGSNMFWLAYPIWLYRRAIYYVTNALKSRRQPNLQRIVLSWIEQAD